MTRQHLNGLTEDELIGLLTELERTKELAEEALLLRMSQTKSVTAEPEQPAIAGRWGFRETRLSPRVEHWPTV